MYNVAFMPKTEKAPLGLFQFPVLSLLQMAQQSFIAPFLDISLSCRLLNTKRSSNFDKISALKFRYDRV